MIEQTSFFTTPEELGYRRKGDILYSRVTNKEYRYKSGGLVNFWVVEEVENIWKNNTVGIVKTKTLRFDNGDSVSFDMEPTSEEREVKWF